MKNWFEVDKEGLAKILARKGKEFILFELVQNAWDEAGVTKVLVSLEYRDRNKALLVVEDDAPEGFKDLSHASLIPSKSRTLNNVDGSIWARN
ncbi:MAG: ATP-binding protein [Verrucomicrobiales bacterium]|nr:ATP-binding protein [Verrucomicrobiales bacterium]